jgi:hypothetical protein
MRKKHIQKQIDSLTDDYQAALFTADHNAGHAALDRWKIEAGAECARRGIKARFYNFGSPHNSQAPQWARKLYDKIKAEELPRFMAHADRIKRKIDRLSNSHKPQTQNAQVIQLQLWPDLSRAA